MMKKWKIILKRCMKRSNVFVVHKMESVYGTKNLHPKIKESENNNLQQFRIRSPFEVQSCLTEEINVRGKTNI